MTFSPSNSQSSYLSPEFDLPKDQNTFYDFINKRERLTATILNVKENGQYEKKELLSGQQWFTTIVSGAAKSKYGFRTTIDMVALIGGNVPIGTNNYPLTTSTFPPAISGFTSPLPSHGSATDTNGLCYFLNEPNLYFRFKPSTNVITITNTTGLAMTQMYIDLEYLKQ